MARVTIGRKKKADARRRAWRGLAALCAAAALIWCALQWGAARSERKPAYEGPTDLAWLLGAYNNTRSLDELTQSEETMNRVELLHLGKTSRHVRLRLLREAKNHLFITVPYWFDDTEGRAFLSAVKAKKAEMRRDGRDLDFRVLVDWVSPASSGDFFATKQYKDIKEAADGKLLQWNSFWRFRPWAQEIHRNRLHDKLFVVDGEKVILGGMNIADEYLQGGETEKGWHDTDLLIEGPAAQQASKYFLKPYLLQEYLDDHSNPFPSDPNFQIYVFQNLFYRDIGYTEYRGERLFTFRQAVNIPLRRELDNPELFPRLPWKNTYTKAVRLIWDQPLLDRKPVSERQYSKLLNVLDFVIPQARQGIKIFLPYPTFTRRMRDLLINARKRGLRVQMITNSIISHDLGVFPYLAGLVNYEPLLKAGVEIYEWQGHSRLKALGAQNGCVPEEWPGHTLHTKAIILDDSVAIIGSNNFNFRSELMNSEVMALVRDRDFARQLADVFEYDLDVEPPGGRTLLCGGSRIPGRPPRTAKIGWEQVRELIRRYGVTAALLDKFKWVF
ncbi:MAG: phosphatidylserine/phosphatidylglycerophosphate/cardiolipin synthase family protein [Bdellovibrionales bacterium]|nr:phosphatidylserine/phosphatidylglycerophosphate/cardiolipin synthase family protein [Bdellovibrionales bacterium]